jgi:hypothetical protein
MVFLTSGSFPILAAQPQLTVFVLYQSTQKSFCAPFAAQFNSNCSPGGRRRNSAPAARANKLGEFFFLHVGRMLMSFTPLKFTDFVKYRLGHRLS